MCFVSISVVTVAFRSGFLLGFALGFAQREFSLGPLRNGRVAFMRLEQHDAGVRKCTEKSNVRDQLPVFKAAPPRAIRTPLATLQNKRV